MHEPLDAAARLKRLDRAAGAVSRDLTLAIGTIRFEGLSGDHARVLDERWGGFVKAPSGDAALVVRCLRGDGTTWLPPWKRGERYRVEAEKTPGPPVVVSYHFALTSGDGRTWRLAIEETGEEPSGRVLDNAGRYLVARLALLRGGFAMHGAGVRRAGKAWIFAGVSGAGKSTAARLSAPAESLGDDFAVVVPDAGDWATCAVPFDNAERAPAAPVQGLVPLARVCRIYQAAEHGLDRPASPIAQASLLSCLAFPWAIPDAALRAEAAIEALVSAGKLVHLRFARDPGFWRLLEA